MSTVRASGTLRAGATLRASGDEEEDMFQHLENHLSTLEVDSEGDDYNGALYTLTRALCACVSIEVIVTSSWCYITCRRHYDVSR